MCMEYTIIASYRLRKIRFLNANSKPTQFLVSNHFPSISNFHNNFSILQSAENYRFYDFPQLKLSLFGIQIHLRKPHNSVAEFAFSLFLGLNFLFPTRKARKIGIMVALNFPHKVCFYCNSRRRSTETPV